MKKFATPWKSMTTKGRACSSKSRRASLTCRHATYAPTTTATNVKPLQSLDDQSQGFSHADASNNGTTFPNVTGGPGGEANASRGPSGHRSSVPK